VATPGSSNDRAIEDAGVLGVLLMLMDLGPIVSNSRICDGWGKPVRCLWASESTI
jgi:hypothetical protein